MIRRADTQAGLRVGWYADTVDERMASVRLRMLLPIRALVAEGVAADLVVPGMSARSHAVLVIAKSTSARALALAQQAKRGGRALIFDICDNLFASKLRGDRTALARLVRLLELADVVTVSTAVLLDQLRREMPAITAKARIIPDMIETVEDFAAHPPSAAANWHLARLRRFLSRYPDSLHCLWFGKSNGSRAGVVHLTAGVRELERFAAKGHPLPTLTLVSNANSYWRYLVTSRGWRVPTIFIPWSLASFGPVAALHRVAVLPVERNDYTVGKTINRPATAIMAGLGVVADALSSYEELRSFVALDDWQGGLAHYQRIDPRHDPLLMAARDYLLHRYGAEAIGKQWAALFRDIAPAAELT